MNCNARERGDLCGADDCRTCHPENFDDDGHLLTVCETCGERFSAAFDETVCPDCEERAEEELEELDANPTVDPRPTGTGEKQ
jgi:hypothetical protein